MTQHDALLAAMCAAPDDDLPQLVYADWCDENGDPDRAEFIRTQIEIANLVLSAIWLVAPVIRELARQPWMTRITRLELERNHAGDDGGRALVESPHLEHIERLDLRINDGFDPVTGSSPMSDTVKRLLKRRFGKRVLV